MVAGSFELDPSAKYKGAKPVHGNEAREIEAIRYSISKGQNHIDCAELYGAFYTDEVVGQALAGAKRKDLYIADKLWKTSVGKGKARETVQQMLKKLGTDYLDMLYIHAPWDDAPWREAIPQIDELIDEGIVKSFGVSNFTIDDMREVMSLSKHPLVANQMEYNVLFKEAVTPEFRNFCREHDIQIVAYQPVRRKAALSNETVIRIAGQHGATPAQVALAWLLAQGALPIPKAMQKSHIDENLKAVDLVLTNEELAELNDL